MGANAGRVCRKCTQHTQEGGITTQNLRFSFAIQLCTRGGFKLQNLPLSQVTIPRISTTSLTGHRLPITVHEIIHFVHLRRFVVYRASIFNVKMTNAAAMPHFRLVVSDDWTAHAANARFLPTAAVVCHGPETLPKNLYRPFANFLTTFNLSKFGLGNSESQAAQRRSSPRRSSKNQRRFIVHVCVAHFPLPLSNHNPINSHHYRHRPTIVRRYIHTTPLREPLITLQRPLNSIRRLLDSPQFTFLAQTYTWTFSSSSSRRLLSPYSVMK